MPDIPKIYNDPIIHRRRKGTHIDPFKNIVESLTIEKHYVILTEIPNRYDKVKVFGREEEFYEVEDEYKILEENTYWVDYVQGIVYFHESLHGRTLNFKYTGEGVYLFPDSRIYRTEDPDFPNLRDKITDIDRAILVERHRIDEQIMSHPQPSEVVDIRIDYNGKIFRVAKDRIDAEQRKIEEAYVDAKGKRYNSLKERIDSLQMMTEEEFDEQERENKKIWAEIELVPGKIRLETGKLREEIDGQIELLQSQIDMTPEQIRMRVRELKEYADGRFSSQYSEMKMLSDRIDLKVDVDGVISSINLSKEGVRLQGKRIHLDGETRIDNAIIKSSHIDSLSADKIRAGILRSQNKNTSFNLNTGELTMQKANFTISSGARINFNDPGNKIQYMQVDPQTGDENYVGVGLGRNINRRFPFIYLGTTRNSELRATENVDFTGFVSNTDARIDADKAANSVVGDRFHIRDKVKGYVYGFRFDLSKKVKTFRGMNTHHDGVHYDIGERKRRFRNVYANYIRNNGEIHLRDSREGRRGGWLAQTHPSGGAITFRGLNGSSYNYQIGGNSRSHRIRRIYLRNKPNVSSDARLKENIEQLGLGLDFMLSLDPVSFRFKKTKADKTKNKNEFGFIAQQVEKTLEKYEIDIENHSLISRDGDGFLAMEHEQLIAPLTKSIQELYYLTRKENKELKDEIEVLKGQISQLQGSVIK